MKAKDLFLILEGTRPCVPNFNSSGTQGRVPSI